MTMRRKKSPAHVIKRRWFKRYSCIDCQVGKHNGWCEKWGGRCQCQEDGHDLVFDKDGEW